MLLPISLQISLVVVVLAAAAFDLHSRRIPNWLNLSGIVLGFGLNILYFSVHGAVMAGEGMLLALAVYLPFYLLRGMGAGDVKLMAAVGAIVGPSYWMAVLILTALAGGVAGLVYAVLKGRLTEISCNLWFLVKDLLQLRAPHRTNPELDFRNTNALRMPHGVMIAAGCLGFLAVGLYSPTLRLFLSVDNTQIILRAQWIT